MKNQSFLVAMLSLCLLPPASAADSNNGVGGSFFFEGQQQERAQLQRKDTAILSREDRARILKKAFACDSDNGRPGQANCAAEEAEIRRELAERTRRNHEIAKSRLGMMQ